MDNWKTQDIRLAVQGKFSLNSRQANDAVYDAQATIKSQKELVKLNRAGAANNWINWGFFTFPRKLTSYLPIWVWK